MGSKETGTFLGFSVILAIALLITFAALRWLNIPTGSFLDWMVGAASFWWLLVIVTVPWNIHFRAKAVLADGVESRKKGIQVDEGQMRYVHQIATRSFGVAIALHLLSALGLYWLAASGVSSIGYISSAATLLFTGLRPALALYQFLAKRLQEIGQTLRYPREDVVELRHRVLQVESRLTKVDDQLNPDYADSQVATLQRAINALRQDLTQLAAAHEDLKRLNQADHDRLSREARAAIAQLSTDGQVLDHVREIIRFFKTA